jgi:hypothetical protein
MKQDIGKTGNAPIVKVGQTASGVFGSEPGAKAKGVVGGKPSDLNYGGK